MVQFFDNLDYNLIYMTLVAYGLQILKVLIILFIGLKLIKWFTNHLSNRFEGSKIDPSLRSFLIPLISITLKITLFITVITMLGIEMTSFIALIGSFGLAVGLALQGSLSNFAGGVLILLFKPFKVGDVIEAKGFSGTVKDITIFYTILATADNKKIVIPNSAVSNDSVINYSSYPTRRVEIKVSCHYKNDIYKVQEILINLLKSHDLILKDPVPAVSLTAYADQSINFSAFGWVKVADFAKVYNDLMFMVKNEFDKQGIIIPHQQIDVNLYDQNVSK
ncbi:MAG: putative mechanosensitive ion-channel [Haloplasmataceae bacterium]|jgi:small conductance mechanosensitive channel|nr:putative mechanosensitive ion-channel [Haloplasmataceae bacterium]